MSGSHRAGSTRAPLFRVLAVLGVLILLGLLAWTIWLRPDARDGNAGAANTPPPATTPTAAPPSSPLPTPSTEPSPSPSTRPSPAALPELRESSPRRLVVPGVIDVGFTSSVEGTDGRLIPTSRTRLSRWAARGLPASPGTRSVVVVGAANVNGRGSLSALSRVRPGARIELRTDAGVLTYTVRESRKLTVAGQVDHPLLSDQRGRLVLIGALYDTGGDRPNQDLVVIAELTAVAAG